jgi:uncharacterized membrane protein YkvI
MSTATSDTSQRGTSGGVLGRYLLPGIVLQSVLIGGGYATGREIVEFGAKYGSIGWIAGLVILVGFGLLAFLTFEVARRFQAFDYRTLVQHLIGPAWPLYDLLYATMAVLVVAIMAAATGEIVNQTTGLPGAVGVVAIIVVVGALTFLGANAIERFKTYGTVALFAAYLIFSVFTIASRWDEIGHTLSSGAASAPNAGLGPVVWSGILYVGYNLVVYPAALLTVRRQTRLRETALAGVIAAVLMTVPWFLTYFSLMGFYPDATVMESSVPWLEMLDAQAAWLVVLFGIVVGWTLVETATGIVFALLVRTDQGLRDAGRKGLGQWSHSAIAVAILVVSLLLAQVGVIDLVAKGYTWMGYGFIVTFALPLLVRGSYLIFTGKGRASGDPGPAAYDEHGAL